MIHKKFILYLFGIILITIFILSLYLNLKSSQSPETQQPPPSQTPPPQSPKTNPVETTTTTTTSTTTIPSTPLSPNTDNIVKLPEKEKTYSCAYPPLLYPAQNLPNEGEICVIIRTHPDHVSPAIRQMLSCLEQMEYPYWKAFFFFR
jgi:hypothetical protein